MRAIDQARAALDRAQEEQDALKRSLWLAKAADYGIKDQAVLVGGAAVNLHTGMYQPTDVDLCAHLDESDRLSMVELGFENTQGDHFRFEFDDGQVWLIEFPDSQLDGEISIIRLSSDDSLRVIRLESLIVDRLLQATDGTGVTFDEAVMLSVAVHGDADWDRVSSEIETRHSLAPMLELPGVYERVVEKTRSLLEAADR